MVHILLSSRFSVRHLEIGNLEATLTPNVKTLDDVAGIGRCEDNLDFGCESKMSAGLNQYRQMRQICLSVKWFR